MNDDVTIATAQQLIEFLGTFAFAISGIRHAAAKHFDWFGGYVCGIAVAIGGGRLREVMLGATPFWMTNPIYIICTALALCMVILCSKRMERLQNAWFVFDTLGLALFTIAGIQKSLDYGQPFWVAIIMGCITGSAGGVIRDILLNNEPVILRKEIYAMASVAGGFVYWGLSELDVAIQLTALLSFVITCAIRFLAVRYHVSLPQLKTDDEINRVDNG